MTDVENLKENKILPLDKIQPHPKNYRKHPEKQIQDLKASLLRFGQGRSVVVQDGPHGYITVAGHGIIEAARQLGYLSIRADILPASWTDLQIQGYLVADNQHSNNSTDDEFALAEMLQDQIDEGFDLSSLGYSEESFQELLNRLYPEIEKQMQDYQGEDKEDNWAVIHVRVRPEIKKLYDFLMTEAEGQSDGEKLGWILKRVQIEEEFWFGEEQHV